LPASMVAAAPRAGQGPLSSVASPASKSPSPGAKPSISESSRRPSSPRLMHPLPESCVALASRMIARDTVVPYHSGRPDAEQLLSDELAELAGEWGLAARQLAISE